MFSFQDHRRCRQQSIVPLLACLCALLLLEGSRATTTFLPASIVIGADVPDFCYGKDQFCGQPAANNFCISKGFYSAQSFSPSTRTAGRKVASTKAMGSGTVCTDTDLANGPSCFTFNSITCQSASEDGHHGQYVLTGADLLFPETTASNSPFRRLNAAYIPFLASAQPAADNQCQRAGFIQATTFAVSPLTGTPSIIASNRQLCDGTNLATGCAGMYTSITCNFDFDSPKFEFHANPTSPLLVQNPADHTKAAYVTDQYSGAFGFYPAAAADHFCHTAGYATAFSYTFAPPPLPPPGTSAPALLRLGDNSICAASAGCKVLTDVLCAETMSGSGLGPLETQRQFDAPRMRADVETRIGGSVIFTDELLLDFDPSPTRTGGVEACRRYCQAVGSYTDCHWAVEQEMEYSTYHTLYSTKHIIPSTPSTACTAGQFGQGQSCKSFEYVQCRQPAIPVIRK